MALIGIDVGTSGCKCVIYASNGSVLNSAYSEYSLDVSVGGRVELNPDNVWAHVSRVIGRAAEGVAFEEKTALAVSSFGEAGVILDKRGRVLYNSLMYTDTRGQEELNALVGEIGAAKIMEITGLPAHPMYTLPKLMWLKAYQPDVIKHSWKFLLYQDFIAFRLCGETAIDYSLASRTMAFDVVQKKWSNEMLGVLDVTNSFFAEPCQAGTRIGRILPGIASELGLPPDTIVAAGGHDQACAALGAGILDGGHAVNGMGTADCITTVLNHPVLSEDMLKNNFNCEPYLLPDRYISLGFSFTGGALLKWYRDCFGAVAIQRAKRKKMSVYAMLDQEAFSEPTGLLVLPHFDGAGTPYMDPAAVGAIVGINIGTTSAQIYRSLLEGVAYEMRYNLECMERTGIQVRELTAAGGGSVSRLWLQIKADIFRRPIRTLRISEAGTLAAAMLAGQAAGVYESCVQAANQLISEKESFVPDPAAAAAYDEHYDRYKRLYAALRRIYAR